MKSTVSVFMFLLLLSIISYSQDKIFTESDTEISVTTGETFDIKLTSNKSTGYSWSVTIEEPNPPGVVTELGSDYQAPQAGKLGASGSEIWHFSAAESGFVKLVFRYSQPWDTEKEPAKTITFNVNVQ
jgi:inhibitor of cysteine peptidase